MLIFLLHCHMMLIDILMNDQMLIIIAYAKDPDADVSFLYIYKRNNDKSQSNYMHCTSKVATFVTLLTNKASS